MTDVPVSQEARESAARAGLELSRLTERDAEALRQGGAWDEWSLVQAFAKFEQSIRQQAERDVIARAALGETMTDTGQAFNVRRAIEALSIDYTFVEIDGREYEMVEKYELSQFRNELASVMEQALAIAQAALRAKDTRP